MSLHDRFGFGVLVPALLSVALSGPLLANEQQQPPMQPGPGKADLAGSVAEIQYGEGFAFADAAATKRLMEMMGNRPSGDEVGLLAPREKDQDWFVIFEWRSVGFVKDDDKDKIDEKALFDSIKEGTEEANRYRKEKGMATLELVGWDEKPHYDEKTHNLVWSLVAKDSEGDQVVNLNQRLLGRDGYMSVTLVADPKTIQAIKPQLGTLLAGFSYKQGKRYAEWKPGDKVAQYGLTALVAGGAGAAAVKLGFFAWFGKLFAKAGKAIVAGLVALGAGAKRLFSWITGRRKEEEGTITPG